MYNESEWLSIFFARQEYLKKKHLSNEQQNIIVEDLQRNSTSYYPIFWGILS